MMHGQEVFILVVELSAALGAYEAVNLQRTFPEVVCWSNVLSQLSDDLFNGFFFNG
jgi:hypothetical protein